MAFPSSRVVVFVDGCFWHACPIHGVTPKANRAFWMKKIARNTLRDKRVNSELKGLGWTVIRFWEHELRHDLDKAVSRVEKVVLRQASRMRGTRKRT